MLGANVAGALERLAHRQQIERQIDRLEDVVKIVSHDLRNPLNVATGHVEIARRDCESASLEPVSDALERAVDIIDDILLVAKHGRSIDETEPMELSAVSKHCWRTVQTGDADLVIEGDVTFEGDRGRVMHLLENLFRNAVEHGGPTVTVRVGHLVDEDGFFVEDDGPGIPTADRDRIFESGFTTREGGIGFGLRIVQGIVDGHGWGITVTEGRSGGARFEVTGIDPR